MTVEKLPAVVYEAKSTADPHASIPGQLADGRKLATDMGYEVMAEFSDVARSAYSADRGSGLVDAMALCERLAAERGGCALSIQHSDRLSRGDGAQARHLNFYVNWAASTEFGC
jgi:Resolvase, N terminal domain